MANLLTHCTLIGPIVNCKCCGSMLSLIGLNRPFPSSPGPLLQNEGRCSGFDMEIIFHSHANKTHFHKKGCAPSLILKVRVFGTREWPILFFIIIQYHAPKQRKIKFKPRIKLNHHINIDTIALFPKDPRKLNSVNNMVRM